jgi:hypothetical protein
MSDFNLPSLPGPEQQLLNRQRQLPWARFILGSIDQEGQRQAVGAFVSLATDDDQKEWSLRRAFAQEWTSDFDL